MPLARAVWRRVRAKADLHDVEVRHVEEFRRRPAGARGRTGGRAEAIYRSIFDAVVDQRLPPGAKLAEEQLGAVFDASRTIVRSALQALAHDSDRNDRTPPRRLRLRPDVADAQDIFFSRRLVESGVALEVAHR